MNQKSLTPFLSLILLLFMATCKENSQETQLADADQTISVPELKIIEPSIGFTPDISEDAAKNLRRIKEIRMKIDSIIKTYPDYETAMQHLTERQIEIWENEEEAEKEDHLDVGTIGCSWYCGGGPESITASSELKPHKDLNYTAENIHDFSLRTAWVEGADGYGIGESISFRFAKNSPPVTTVEIFNGYMKSEKVWQENSRVKQLKLYINERPYALLNLKDIKSKQIFALDTLQGTSDDLVLKFEITDVYKGEKYDDVAISEIEFDGIGVHCFAKGTMIATPAGQIEIENLKEGDYVLSRDELTGKLENSQVIGLAQQKHHNLYELDFSGIKITVTEDHPFYHKGRFYSVVANSFYGIPSSELMVGQNIEFLAGKNPETRQLTGIKKTNRCEMTYTITKLDRNRIFYANGAAVVVEEVSFSFAGENPH